MQDEEPTVDDQIPATDPVLEPAPPISDPHPEPVADVPVSDPAHLPKPVPIPDPQPTPEQVTALLVTTTPIPQPAQPPEPTSEPVLTSQTPPSISEPAQTADPIPTPPVAPSPPPVVVTPPAPSVSEPTAQQSPIPRDPVLADPPKNPPTQPNPEPTEQETIPQKVLNLTPEELDAARRLWATQNIHSVQAKSAHDRTARRDVLLDQIENYIKSHAPATLSMIAYNINISPRKASNYLCILVKTARVKASGATSSRQYS